MADGVMDCCPDSTSVSTLILKRKCCALEFCFPLECVLCLVDLFSVKNSFGFVGLGDTSLLGMLFLSQTLVVVARNLAVNKGDRNF